LNSWSQPSSTLQAGVHTSYWTGDQLSNVVIMLYTICICGAAFVAVTEVRKQYFKKMNIFILKKKQKKTLQNSCLNSMINDQAAVIIDGLFLTFAYSQ
jgi:hypothetical protein